MLLNFGRYTRWFRRRCRIKVKKTVIAINLILTDYFVMITFTTANQFNFGILFVNHNQYSIIIYENKNF